MTFARYLTWAGRATSHVAPAVIGGLMLAFASTTSAYAACEVNVNDDGFAVGTVQGAVDAAGANGKVVVKGVCTENVAIETDGLELIGANLGGSIVDASLGADPVIEIIGRNVGIKKLTITGGAQGIRVRAGGSATIGGSSGTAGNTISGAALHGILVSQNSHATIVDNVLDDSAGSAPVDGIVVRLSSSAIIRANDVVNHGENGIKIVGGGADIENNVITGNGESGIRVASQPRTRLSYNNTPNTIEGNGLYGITCVSGGNIHVVVAQNWGAGNPEKNANISSSCFIFNEGGDPEFPGRNR